MTDEIMLLPEWLAFERDYLATGVPHRIRVQGKPAVELFVGQGSASVGARFELVHARIGRPSFALSQIHVDETVREGCRYIEIWTDARSLFANFYRLVVEVVDAVVNGGSHPDAALIAAVDRWKALLSRPDLMSDEVQSGLFGELWLLERLIVAHGAVAVSAWVGPFGQVHDFRAKNIEIEVKTTTGNARIHRITGLQQMQPSIDCDLYLLSLKLVNAGAGGRSLSDIINSIEAILARSDHELAKFKAALDELRYDPDAAHLYPSRRRLRDSAVLVPIIDGMPRLTTDAIASLDTRYSPHLISGVTYSVDVEGLGFEDGHDEFDAVISSTSVSGAYDV